MEIQGNQERESSVLAFLWQVELLQEGAVERLRHDLLEQSGSVAALKGLVEKQLREQQDVAAVLQAHTRVIMREVCKWTRGYIEIRLSDFALPPLAARDAEPKQVEAASDET